MMIVYAHHLGICTTVMQGYRYDHRLHPCIQDVWQLHTLIYAVHMLLVVLAACTARMYPWGERAIRQV